MVHRPAADVYRFGEDVLPQFHFSTPRGVSSFCTPLFCARLQTPLSVLLASWAVLCLVLPFVPPALSGYLMVRLRLFARNAKCLRRGVRPGEGES